jgi:hypothetical protein
LDFLKKIQSQQNRKGKSVMERKRRKGVLKGKKRTRDFGNHFNISVIPLEHPQLSF